MTTDPAAGSPPRVGLLASLRHPDYRRLMVSFTVSSIGTWAYSVALVVWVYGRTGSLGWLTVVGVCRFLPGLLLSAYAGVLADRFEKVRLMVRTDVVFAVLMAAMAVVVGLDGPVIALLALVTLACALGTVYEPASAGLTPLVVPERDLASANALRNTVDNLTVIAGPGLGALLLALGPPVVTFWVNAATFAASALVLARMRTRSRPVDVTEGGDRGPLAQTVVGIRAITASPTVAVMVGYCVLATLVYGIDTVLFVPISADLLGTGPDGYGYLLAGLGVGGVLAAPLVTRAEARPSVGPVLLAGMAAYCLPTLLLLVTHSPVVAFLVQVVRGAGTLFVDVLAVTALQRTLPGELVARVFGAFNALVVAAVLVGSTLATWVVSVGGVHAGVWLAGGGSFAVSLLGLPWLRRMDRLARDRRRALAPRIELIEAGDLFARVPDGGLAQLAGAAVSVDVPAGTPVVRQGEPADAFYVVETGTLVVSVASPAGSAGSGTLRQPAVPELGPGDYFGEIGLIEGIARTATVTASSACRLLRVDGEAFLEALTTGSPSAAILDGAAVRLGRTHPALSLRRAGLAGADGGGTR